MKKYTLHITALVVGIVIVAGIYQGRRMLQDTRDALGVATSLSTTGDDETTTAAAAPTVAAEVDDAPEADVDRGRKGKRGKRRANREAAALDPAAFEDIQANFRREQIVSRENMDRLRRPMLIDPTRLEQIRAAAAHLQEKDEIADTAAPTP